MQHISPRWCGRRAQIEHEISVMMMMMCHSIRRARVHVFVCMRVAGVCVCVYVCIVCLSLVHRQPRLRGFRFHKPLVCLLYTGLASDSTTWYVCTSPTDASATRGTATLGGQQPVRGCLRWEVAQSPEKPGVEEKGKSESSHVTASMQSRERGLWALRRKPREQTSRFLFGQTATATVTARRKCYLGIC